MTFVYSRVNYKDLPCHITVDGKTYDCTVWKDHHPGGDEIMMKYHDKDATDVFYAFHGPEGIEKLKKMTPTSTKPPAVTEQEQAFRDLRQKLVNEGLFDASKWWYFYKTSETLAILVLGLILTYLGHWVIGAILCGLSYQQQGWLAHDLSHHQLFKTRRLNNFMTYFIGSVCSGYSVNWWKERHNSHHAITNVLEGDPDVDNLPLFVWAEEDLVRVPTMPISAKLVPFQHYYFLPFTFWLKIIWNLQSLAFISNTHNVPLNKVAIYERLTLLAHYTWIALVIFHWLPSWKAGLAWFFISELLAGACIANVVFMNHYACKQMTWDEGQQATFLELQLYTTRNVDPGPFMNWFCGGLNFQVEHHLFPMMPRYNLSRARTQVQEFAQKHGLPYQSLSFFGCMSEVLTKLRDVSVAFVKQQQAQQPSK